MTDKWSMFFLLVLLSLIAKEITTDLVVYWSTTSREDANTQIAILSLTIIGIGVVLFMIFKTKPEK